MNLSPPVGIDLLVLPGVHLLDLAGPAQVFAHRTVNCPLRMLGPCADVTSAQGLPIGPVEPLGDQQGTNRWLLVIGSTAISTWLNSRDGRRTVAWLRTHAAQWARVGSVCAGALVLADAGLLAGRRATTHHSLLDDLQHRETSAQVVDDCLFVDDGERCTSAGLSSAIDLALHLVGRHWGETIADTIARDLVIYQRAADGRDTTPLPSQHRHHPDQRIHAAQDHIDTDLHTTGGVNALAATACLSERQFRRRFQAATGVSVQRYIQLARLACSETLLRNTTLPIDTVAERAGFADARSLQRLWQRERGCRPSDIRAD